jgi:colanic acid/amylovoran biosynthesis glycosyltransferase
MKTVVLHSIHVWLYQTNTWLYNQVRCLPDFVETHVVCELTLNLDQFPIPNIHCLAAVPKWRYLLHQWFRRKRSTFLVDIAKKYNARILHSHFGDIGWTNIKVAKRAGMKHVITFYGVDVNYLPKQEGIWSDRYRTLFIFADCVFCEGPHMASRIEALGCPVEKIRIQHLGVNLKEIPFKPRCWCPGGPLRVLIAASFREKKGIPYALEALERLSKEVPLEITLIGDAHPEERSQEEKRKILQKIEHLGLQSRVRRLGYQPYQVFLEEAYKHHVFLSPSITASDGDTEGGAPVSITEMVASGMPVISTFHCDIPEIIQHGVSGLLAEERDVEGLVKHLRWLIEHADSWSQMIEAGRNHVAAEFDARKQGEKLAQIYQELISS